MRNKKTVPYSRLSRRKRRDSFVRLRQKIRNQTPAYGGQFTSHHVLNEPGRPPLYNQWSDIYFLGNDGLTIWNAEIVTTGRRFWDIVEEMAHNRAWSMLSPEEQAAEVDMKFEPIWHNGQRMYRLIPRPKLTYEQYGGLTYGEYQDKLVEEIIRAEPPEVFESFETDRSYRYGIGLTMVIKAEEVNQATIEDAIRRFREVGETDWRAAEPVSRSELPVESANTSFSRIHWEPNAPGNLQPTRPD